MSLPVPKSKYSRLQLPYGVASSYAARIAPYADDIIEPDNAMEGSLEWDPFRSVVRAKTKFQGWQDLVLASGYVQDNGVNEFRLSASAGQPDTLANGVFSTIYLVPYKGNSITLVDPKTNEYRLYRSTVLSGYTLSGRTAFLPFDIFVSVGANEPYDSAQLTLTPLNWSSTTARATPLFSNDGVFYNSANAYQRYVGTVRPISATTYRIMIDASDNVTPPGIGYWNVDNRRQMGVFGKYFGNNYAYTGGYRTATGNGAFEITYVCGLNNADAHHVNVITSVSSSGSTTSFASAGIALDTTAGINVGINHIAEVTVVNKQIPLNSTISTYSRLGVHTYVWVEMGGTNHSFVGTGSQPDSHPGITATIWY